MINIEKFVQQLRTNANIVNAIVRPLSLEQSQWQPDPETWSLTKVMEHLYNEERLDFRKHLQEILSDPPKPWEAFQPKEYIPVKSCHQALESFLIERESSVEWLTRLESPDWDLSSQASLGPTGEVLTLSAGDLLVSWVAHDFLHVRQMNELLFAWNEEQGKPFSVQYAGGW